MLASDTIISDEQLLSDFAGGRTAALGELAERHERFLLGLARGLLDGAADRAAEAVQETWLRVIRHAAGFHQGSRAKTWLYRILINQCRDLRRRDARSAGSAVDLSLVRGSAAEDAYDEQRQRQAAVRSAVQTLTRDQQAVVLLCYHEALTHEEAAELLEIPLGTLKSRLNAALSALRDVLQSRDGK